jgi:hypothetical protein
MAPTAPQSAGYCMKHKVHPGKSLSLGTASSTIDEVNHKGGQMTRNRRITTVAAGAAGITAVALGVAGAFPSGASVGPVATPSLPIPASLPSAASLPGAGSLPTLPGVPTSIPPGSQCVGTPATPALPVPASAGGSGNVTTSYDGGSVTGSSSSGANFCTTGVPSLPSVPGLPSASSIPSVPGLPSASSLPGLPSASSIPGVPGLPSASSLPGLLGGFSFSVSGSGS